MDLYLQAWSILDTTNTISVWLGSHNILPLIVLQPTFKRERMKKKRFGLGFDSGNENNYCGLPNPKSGTETKYRNNSRNVSTAFYAKCGREVLWRTLLVFYYSSVRRSYWLQPGTCHRQVLTSLTVSILKRNPANSFLWVWRTWTQTMATEEQFFESSRSH